MDPITVRKNLQDLDSQATQTKVESILGPLVVSNDTIQRIMSTMEEQILFSNSKDEDKRKKSDMFWECTYVKNLLQGNETGDFLGLDLGSTNFRVVRVVLKEGKADTTTKYYNLPKVLLTGPAEKAFDHIASSIQQFIIEENIASKAVIPLGFTFSFPSIQKSLKHSILIVWTKSFKCTTGVGQDPVTLLEDAIARRGGFSVPVDVVARISDTTGTLMAGNYVDKNCRIGLILGSGSNACFVERAENFNKLEPEERTSNQILVNCEWGAFGDNGCLDFLRTEFDNELDRNSNHVGSYTFEKYFGGFYIGELVRLVLVKLVKENLLFNGQLSEMLNQKDSFPTAYVTNVESDSPGESEKTRDVLKQVGIFTASDTDEKLVQEVCALVSERGAFIVAAAVAVLVHHIDLPEVTIGVDGSVYEHHPKFHDYMMNVLRIHAPKTKCKILLVKDGSGQGAAFVAAVEYKDSH